MGGGDNDTGPDDGYAQNAGMYRILSIDATYCRRMFGVDALSPALMPRASMPVYNILQKDV